MISSNRQASGIAISAKRIAEIEFLLTPDGRDEWIEKAMSEFDVLALPSAQVWPFSINCRYPKSIGEKRMETYHQWMQVCAPVSFAGLPCVTIPAGFSEVGLPMGIQVFGRRGNDMLLLSLASKYHCATKGTRQTVSYTKGEDAVLTTP